MPLQATSGAASYDAFGGGGAAVEPNYIESVFSTYLYTGTGASQTITNGIDLSTKGGMTWLKARNDNASHYLFDTARGRAYSIRSDSVGAQATSGSTDDLTSFNSNGFSLGLSSQTYVNANNINFVSWTFRKQPKFFDVVTYTGDGANRTIAHNLGSAPGCMIIKATSAIKDWAVYHRSTGNTKYLSLNTTASAATSASYWNNTDPTSTVFTVGIDGDVNQNGVTYVAYLFAHDAGGFGLAGTDNVISCGSFTTDGAAAATVSLGYEPQWVLFKRTDSATNGDWVMFDNMRGLPATGTGSLAARLIANTSAAENPITGDIKITSTGFVIDYVANAPFIYVAIRRGPMKVPTTGTSVFSPNVPTAFAQFTTGFPVDLGMWFYKPGYSLNTVVNDRLRGVSTTNTTAFPNNLTTSSTDAQATAGQSTQNWNNTGLYAVTSLAVWYSFRRAPSFMDEVCYTGTGSSMSITHNLGVGPELVIVKRRNSTSDWQVAAKINSTQYTVGASGNELALNSSGGGTTTYYTYATYFSSTAFQTGAFWTTPNINGGTYVAYLFATCAGVSKVGSYTGTATTLQIDCGFTAGARFVLIKRTDSTGDWYVWDTARGIVSGNDSYLLLNSTAAEVTNTDYIDTYSAGFEISSTAPAAINANGGSFIFFAVAQSQPYIAIT